jgi:hypothetical protein
MDKRTMLPLVDGTGWNQFIELNRMAFSDELPRNSESRAISVAMRMLRQQAPHIKWVVSFADGSQCGDGTIYRASGFLLTGIKRNDQIWRNADGATVSRMTMTKGSHVAKAGGGASMSAAKAAGFAPIPGFQLRYIYFLDSTWRSRLTVAEIPFAKIAEVGASMYKGKTLRAEKSSAGGSTIGEGGAVPTSALQSDDNETPHTTASR